jgi:hypothetical protein
MSQIILFRYQPLLTEILEESLAEDIDLRHELAKLCDDIGSPEEIIKSERITGIGTVIIGTANEVSGAKIDHIG